MFSLRKSYGFEVPGALEATPEELVGRRFARVGALGARRRVPPALEGVFEGLRGPRGGTSRGS